MVQGLSDNDIRDLVDGEPEKTLEDTVIYVEGRESGKSSNRLMLVITPTVNKISTFQRLNTKSWDSKAKKEIRKLAKNLLRVTRWPISLRSRQQCSRP